MENNIDIGTKFVHEFSFTQNDVLNFANASGDFNPIHLDAEYARNTIFKRTIVHGFLGGSVFSKVFGTIFPGNGTIYLKQEMIFYKPIFTNENYIATFLILQIDKIKNRAVVETIILDKDYHTVIKGEAIIKHPIFS